MYIYRVFFGLNMYMRKILISVPSYPMSGMRYLPLVWACLKSYYENFSDFKDEWEWLPPLQDAADLPSVLEQAENIDILGLSNYMWNSKVNYKLAKEFKKRNPNCLIVCGGPEFDQLKPENFENIDIYIPIEGEATFSQILDNVYLDIPWKDIGGIVYLDKEIKRNPALPFIKEWQYSPLLENKKFMENIIEKNKEQGFETLLQFETTRGCPYACTFCDWGGGIHTKLRQRPVDILKEEITWTGKNKIFKYFITDANFGILSRDKEVAQHIVDTKKKYGYPLGVVIQSAKNQTERIVDIVEILYKGGLISRHTISVQSTNDNVLDNIHRSNLPTEKQKVISNNLNKKGIPVKSQIILGLPGDTLDRLKQTISDLHNMGVSRDIEYFVFGLFPNAPASEKLYIEKHKIKTVSGYTPVYCRDLETFEGYSGKDLQVCNGLQYSDNESVYQDESLHQDTIWDISNNQSKFVISTSSYDEEQWAEMHTWINFINGINESGLFKNVADYYRSKGIDYKEFYDNVIADFRQDKDFDNLYEYVIQQSYDFAKGNRPYEEMSVPGSNLPVAFEANLFIQSWIAKNKTKVYDEFRPMVTERYNHAIEVDSLIKFGLDKIVGFDLQNKKENTYEYDWENITNHKQYNNITKKETTYKFENSYINNFKKLQVPMDMYHYSLCLVYGRWRKKLLYSIS